ncbi:MAG: OmpA family protein [Magnetococcales bacterium]|nr:OmpA family protein [Magnetococcales bacterium]
MIKRMRQPRRGGDEGPGNPFWISYADLMTALVMLFLVVMSLSMVAIASRPLVEKKQRAGEIRMILARMDLMAEEVGLDVQVNQEDFSIGFGERARFPFNSYQLTPEAVEILRSFVPVLLATRERPDGERWLERVHIEGYTDAVGSYLYNVDLSLKRAEAVLCALLSADLPPEQLRRLQELLVIDGASVTAIRPSPEESRRVEVRLEFRRTDDIRRARVSPDLPLGRCAIPMEEARKGVVASSEKGVVRETGPESSFPHGMGIWLDQLQEAP